MEKLLKYIMVGGLLLPMAGCGGAQSADPQELVEYYPVKVDEDDDWSFVDADGNVLLPDEFENRPTAVINGHFTVEEGEGYSVYKFDPKHPKQVPGLDGLSMAGYYNNDVIGVVRPLERITYVKEDGSEKFVLDPIDGREITKSEIDFGDGLMRVWNEEDKVGFVNDCGDVVIKLKYTMATPFGEGHALVKKEKVDKTATYIINKKGEETEVKRDLEIYAWTTFKDGIVAVSENTDAGERWGLLNIQGEFTKLPTKVKRVSDYNSKVIVYVDADDKVGVMTHSGEDMIRPKYSKIVILDNDRYLACKGDKFMLINSDGEKLESGLGEYENVYRIRGKGFKLVANDGDTYKLVDFDGKDIGKNEFEKFSDSYSKNYILRSDYFDVRAYVSAISDAVKTGAIGKYRLGARASDYLSSPNDYCYKSAFTPTDTPPAGYRYSFGMTVYCTESIADYTWDQDTGISYYFNPGSTVRAIALEAKTGTDVCKPAKPLLLSALEEKGFTVDENTEDRVTLTSGSRTLILRFASSGITLSLNE